MRNGFSGFCLLMKLPRKVHIKILERLLMLGIKILAVLNDGNIGESHVSHINYCLCQEHLKFQMFKNEIVNNLVYFFTIKC